MNKIILPLLVALLGGIISFFYQNLSGLLSFEAGFLSFLFVFLATFIAFNRQLSSVSLQDGERDGETLPQTFSTSLHSGISLSFSFFRILAYIFLVLVMFVLLYLEFFCIYFYMGGVFLGGLLVVFFFGRKIQNPLPSKIN